VLSPDVERELREKYLESISGYEKLPALLQKHSDLSVSDWKKALASLMKLESSFLGSFVADFAKLCGDAPGIRPSIQPAANVLMVLRSIGLEREIVARIAPALLRLEQKPLTDLAKCIEQRIVSEGNDQHTDEMYQMLCEELNQRKPTGGDEAEPGSAETPAAVAEWPCGTDCKMCGPDIMDFMRSADQQSMTWTSSYTAKKYVLQATNHVLGSYFFLSGCFPCLYGCSNLVSGTESAEKAGLKCEEQPPKSIVLTKSAENLKKRARESSPSNIVGTDSIEPMPEAAAPEAAEPRPKRRKM
jgi:hypothetical protein